jgi:hypothetical protein
MTTVPTWAFVALGLASPFVAVVAILAQVFLEFGRQRHERALKLREDRRRAYAALARMTNWMTAHKEPNTRELAEAYSEIDLLTDNDQLKEAAMWLLEAVIKARDTARSTIDQGGEDPYGTPQYIADRERWGESRSEFIRLAKEELGPTRTWWARLFGS